MSRCVNPRCFGTARTPSNLCGSCKDVCDSAVIVGLCIGLSVFIMALAKLGRMI